MVLYNDVTTSRRAQRMPHKAFSITNNEVTHFNIEMNGFELDSACVVTMNGQSYIFQASKQSNLYEPKYVLVLDPNSRELTFYSKMKDSDRISTCLQWSPGAVGPSKYKNKRSQVALLCFTMAESNKCWIFDDFKKKIRKFRAKTKYSHLKASIGYYQGRPFTVGSQYPANKKTEIYKQESDEWETLPDFPFAKVNIEQYGMASTNSQTLIFGGIYDRHSLNDDVAAYSESGWSKIGKLKTINFQMTSIRVGKDIFVFGGGGDMMTSDKHTEIWRHKRDKSILGTFEVHDIQPIVSDWYMPIVITF